MLAQLRIWCLGLVGPWARGPVGPWARGPGGPVLGLALVVRPRGPVGLWARPHELVLVGPSSWARPGGLVLVGPSSWARPRGPVLVGPSSWVPTTMGSYGNSYGMQWEFLWVPIEILKGCYEHLYGFL